MKRYTILYFDAGINLILGLLLLFYRPGMVHLLGVPWTSVPFYASILGAVLFGIGIALLVEFFRSKGGFVGLGLGGAVAVNLCGGIALAGWLVFGRLNLPLRGKVFLWILVVLLIVVSAGEVVVYKRR